MQYDDAGKASVQALLLSSLYQIPTSYWNLATQALLQQLQMATSPDAVLLFFTLLQHSLGLLTPTDAISAPGNPNVVGPSAAENPENAQFSMLPADAAMGQTQPIDAILGPVSTLQQPQGSVNWSHLTAVLQPQWLLTHYLTGHPCGSDMAAAWDSGLSQLLHAVLCVCLQQCHAPSCMLLPV